VSLGNFNRSKDLKGSVADWRKPARRCKACSRPPEEQAQATGTTRLSAVWTPVCEHVDLGRVGHPNEVRAVWLRGVEIDLSRGRGVHREDESGSVGRPSGRESLSASASCAGQGDLAEPRTVRMHDVEVPGPGPLEHDPPSVGRPAQSAVPVEVRRRDKPEARSVRLDDGHLVHSRRKCDLSAVGRVVARADPLVGHEGEVSTV
jgi:hypothetical protein